MILKEQSTIKRLKINTFFDHVLANVYTSICFLCLRILVHTMIWCEIVWYVALVLLPKCARFWAYECIAFFMKLVGVGWWGMSGLTTGLL